MANTRPPPPPLPIRRTDFARKYGAGGPPRRPSDTGPAQYFEKQGPPKVVKSGLTPLTPLPSNPRTYDKFLYFNIQSFQKKIFYGFTSQDLIDLGAMSPVLDIGSLNLDPVGHQPLDNPIHQIFARSRWTAIPFKQYNIENGYGNIPWSAKHDAVWEVLLPSIRIASHILTMLHTHPWIDALMLGPRAVLDILRLSPADRTRYEPIRAQLETFEPRPIHPNNERSCAQELDSLYRTFQLRTLVWGISHTFEYPVTGEPINPIYGCTIYHSQPGGRNVPSVSLWLSYQGLVPMLRKTLNEAELVGAQLFLAITMVHELQHATSFAQKTRDNLRSNRPVQNNKPEPYFMNEPIHEVGFSAENALFGAMGNMSQNGNFEDPKPAYFLESYPSESGAPEPYLRNPSVPDQRVIFPLEIDFMRSMSQKGFWDARKRTGVDLRPPPAKRVSYNKVGDPPENWTVAEGTAAALAMLPTSASLALDTLLGLNSGDRTIYKQQLVQETRTLLLADDAQDKRQADVVIGQSDLCELVQRTRAYMKEMDNLIVVLKQLLVIQEKRIDSVVTLRRLGETVFAETAQIYNRLREVKRLAQKFARLDIFEAYKVERLDPEIAALSSKLTRTASNQTGATLNDMMNQLVPIVNREVNLLQNLELLFNTDKKQCLADCKILTTSMSCGVIARGIAFIYVGILDTNVVGNDSQVDVENGLLLLDKMKAWVPQFLKSAVAKAVMEGKAFVPFPQPDLFSV